MKKIVFLFLLLCAVNFSCTKKSQVPLTYNVTNDELAADTGMLDIYLPDTGTYTMAVYVRYLTGSPNDVSDTVALALSALPANISVTPGTYQGIPTYNENFVFTSLNAPLGVHPVSLTASVTGETPITYNFNIIVLPANSANIFSGVFNTTNACSASNYQYSVTCYTSDTANVMYISNFGGYGAEANARVLLDPYNGTVTVPQQTVGNGVRLNGSGTYSQTTLTITYSAITTPGGIPDNCTTTIVQ